MSDQSFDPTRFFDHFSRFVETDELGSVVDRLNARYLGIIHENRELIEGATILDLASHDGRFSFAALQNGAAKVVGIEFGADLVRKSLANMEYYNVPADKYEFLSGDIFELIDQIEDCDVVFCFGIFYHINSHLLLLTKIAELDPRTLIVDTNISQLEPAVIELRGPVNGRPLRLGEAVEGYPSRAALDAMLSSFGWSYDYFDWERSGLLERTQMLDYRRGKRVSVMVDCNRQVLSAEERERAVQMVLDTQRDRRSQWHTILEVASRFGVTRQALHSWVRKAERAALQPADLSQRTPPGSAPN
ncbi:MAG: methyltransferase domain-containing protein [Actinomycetota bacterium]|nr:methyltransferase domain-containing protein [Actinomycetota bacterium]